MPTIDLKYFEQAFRSIAFCLHFVYRFVLCLLSSASNLIPAGGNGWRGRCRKASACPTRTCIKKFVFLHSMGYFLRLRFVYALSVSRIVRICLQEDFFLWVTWTRNVDFFTRNGYGYGWDVQGVYCQWCMLCCVVVHAGSVG